jgi:hypothetical protein
MTRALVKLVAGGVLLYVTKHSDPESLWLFLAGNLIGLWMLVTGLVRFALLIIPGGAAMQSVTGFILQAQCANAACAKWRVV